MFYKFVSRWMSGWKRSYDQASSALLDSKGVHGQRGSKDKCKTFLTILKYYLRLLSYKQWNNCIARKDWGVPGANHKAAARNCWWSFISVSLNTAVNQRDLPMQNKNLNKLIGQHSFWRWPNASASKICLNTSAWSCIALLHAPSWVQ